MAKQLFQNLIAGLQQNDQPHMNIWPFSIILQLAIIEFDVVIQW